MQFIPQGSWFIATYKYIEGVVFMKLSRSFKEYVANRFYNQFCDVASNYIEENLSSMTFIIRNSFISDKAAALSIIENKLSALTDMPGHWADSAAYSPSFP